MTCAVGRPQSSSPSSDQPGPCSDFVLVPWASSASQGTTGQDHHSLLTVLSGEERGPRKEVSLQTSMQSLGKIINLWGESRTHFQRVFKKPNYRCSVSTAGHGEEDRQVPTRPAALGQGTTERTIVLRIGGLRA